MALPGRQDVQEMPTIKQVEAFFWSAKLGTGVAAAERLNTTQSNVSRRILELERELGSDLFDRSRRIARLTAKGAELMKVSEEILRAHTRMRQIGKTAAYLGGPFRFGVTDAFAAGWLPRFIAAIKAAFPDLVPTAVIETSHYLNQNLMQRKLDLIVCPEHNIDPSFKRVQVMEMQRAWVASPAFFPDDRLLTVDDLNTLPILGHGDNIARSAVPLLLKAHGVALNVVVSSSSVSALARMAMDGMGITYLYPKAFSKEIAENRLRILRAEIKLPSVRYAAAYQDELSNPLARLVAAKASAACASN